jgi:OOP family OmpA-OmpF porin
MFKIVAPVVCATLAIGLLGCGEDVKIKAEVPAVKVELPPPPVVAVVAPPPPVVAVVAPPVKHVKRTAVLEGNKIKLPGPIVFRTGTADLDPVSDEILEIVFDYMFEKPAITLLRIEGHTDNVGDKTMNQGLSEKRALSATHWLVAKGIDCHRFIAVGFGETKPLVPNTTDDNKAQNRRVDFINAELKHKAIGGLPKDGGGHIAGDPCK